MTSIILRTTTRLLLPLMILYSVFLLVEGHHRPGGGFVGGLIVAAAMGLCALAFDVRTARRSLPLAPPHLMGLGLLAAGASGIWGLLRGEPFLTSAWMPLRLSPELEFELGTPLLFDAGVYLVVIGAVTMILFTLAEE